MKKLQEYLPLLTIVVVSVSFYHQYQYYKIFGIDIYNYLEISEIILSFTNILESLALMLVCYFLFDILPPQKRPAQMAIKPKTFKRIVSVMSILLIIVAAVLLLSENNRLSINESTFDFLFLFFVVMPSCGFFIRILIFLKVILGSAGKKENTVQNTASTDLSLQTEGSQTVDNKQSTASRGSNSGVFSPFVVLMIGFVVFLIIRNNIRYQNIILGRHKYHVSLTFDNGTELETSDSSIYIGSTNNYIFFTNINTKENIIIPRAEVRETRITELRKSL